MTVELPASVEEELRALAVTQSRDLGEILEEAVRLYIEAAITDLDAEEVALRDVHRGLADIEAGCVVSHEEARARLRARYSS